MQLEQHAGPRGGAAPVNLDQLLARCLGNVEFAERILAKFQQRFAEEFSELEAGLAAGNEERVACIAHRLKGASANVSATGVQELLAELEELGRSRRLDEAPALVSRLRNEWSRLCQYLEVCACES
jgi:HPt (histidine-containing phosphotransfer) domain-containing protein